MTEQNLLDNYGIIMAEGFDDINVFKEIQRITKICNLVLEEKNLQDDENSSNDGNFYIRSRRRTIKINLCNDFAELLNVETNDEAIFEVSKMSDVELKNVIMERIKYVIKEELISETMDAIYDEATDINSLAEDSINEIERILKDKNDLEKIISE